MEKRECGGCENWLDSGYDHPYGRLGVCKMLFKGRLDRDLYATICAAYRRGTELEVQMRYRIEMLTRQAGHK